MSLININNSNYVEVQVRSIQLHSDSHGGRYVTEDTTYTEMCARMLDLSHGEAKAYHVREAAGLLTSFYTSNRTLYSLQKMLNSRVWNETKVTVEIEAAIVHTGNGDIDVKELGHIILLVKTTWQDEA